MIVRTTTIGMPYTLIQPREFMDGIYLINSSSCDPTTHGEWRIEEAAEPPTKRARFGTKKISLHV